MFAFRILGPGRRGADGSRTAIRSASRPLRALACAAVLLAPSAFPHPATSAELSIRVRGPHAKGPIPAKRPGGQSDTVGIVGEPVGETEFQAVDEIASAILSGQEGGPNGEIGMRPLAIPGRGGLQNVRDVLGRTGVDFGIAPTIVLDRAAASSEMANLRDRLAYVAPLYVEEMHLLAGPGIDSVSALEGKRVSLGPEGGASEAVAQALLEDLRIKVVTSNLDVRASVGAIRDGSLDAAFVVSGKPVDALRGVGSQGKVHLVPLTSDRIPEGFLPTTLGHDDYPSLIPAGATVPTLGVQNVLFAYDWPLKSARGRVQREFIALLLYRLPDLQVGQNHPKWREVNVAATIPGWKRLPAMQDWLAKAKPRATGPATEAEFEGFLRRTGTKASGETREALYQDFLRWRNTPVAGGPR